MEICKNCGAEISDKYCSHCGQEKITGRLEVKHIFKDATHGIFHWESSILKTIRELVLRPGGFIRNYLGGIRKPYVKPFSYFIFIQTIFVLIFHWYSDQFLAFINPKVNVSGATETEMLKVHEIQHVITSNINYLNFFMPLFLAFFLKLFIKKKTGINYAESVVFSLYVAGTTMIFGIVTMPLASISPVLWEIRLAINMIYLIFVIIQFADYHKLTGIVKGFLVSFLSTITYIIFVLILTLAYAKFVMHLF